MEILGIHGYKLTTVQQLTDSDHEARVSFCEFWLSKLKDDSDLENRIFWSDECLIRLGDPIDISNVRVYAKTNPHARVGRHYLRLGRMSWVAISS